MNKRTIIVISAILILFAGIIVWHNIETSSESTADYGSYNIDTIKEMAENYSGNNLNPDEIIDASKDTGDLPEKTIGDPNNAKVVVYEFADYACSHCATWSAKLDKLVEESNGDLAVVYRGYQLGFDNSVISASAATAAQKQGYWKEYKALLFANQMDWANASGDELTDMLVSYFKDASNNRGDVRKFKKDMPSEAIAKKIAFEHRLGQEIHLSGTPTFRIDGENIEIQNLEETIQRKLSEK